VWVFRRAAGPGDLDSFPTRRSSDLVTRGLAASDASLASSLLVAAPTDAERCSSSPIRDRTSAPMTSGSPSRRWAPPTSRKASSRSEEHTSELQSPYDLVCRLLLEKK